jgi:TPP-dependent indolepyruvate ferredoxin oxidoreductase alpha subunit
MRRQRRPPGSALSHSTASICLPCWRRASFHSVRLTKVWEEEKKKGDAGLHLTAVLSPLQVSE